MRQRLALTVVLGATALAAFPGSAPAITGTDPCAAAGVNGAYLSESGILCGARYEVEFDDGKVQWLPHGAANGLECPPHLYIKGTDYWSSAFSYNWGWDYYVEGGEWVLWDGEVRAYPEDAVLERGFEAYNGLSIQVVNWSGLEGGISQIAVRPFLECVRNPVVRAAANGPGARSAEGAPEELPGGGDGGDNALYGGDGDNALIGMAGHDRIHGHAGEDHLHGGTGEDALFGGAHDDLIHGRRHSDNAVGGNGDDDVLTGKGSDLARGGADDDQLFDNEGRDTLRGGKGNDRFSARDGDRDVIRCGAGEDIAIIDSEDVAVDCEHAYRDAREQPARLPKIPLSADRAGEKGGVYVLCELEAQGRYCFGTPGDDQIFGTDAADDILADAGDDRIVARGGDDTMHGNPGNDELDGGEGNDVFDGGRGDDNLTGTQGDDVIADTSPSDADVVKAGAGDDKVTVEDGDGRDTVSCGAATDKVSADPGDDVDPRCEKT